MTVRDGRGLPNELNLDRAGFMLARAPSQVVDFMDRDAVERVYPAEAAEIVKQNADATHVVPLSWLVRTSGDRQLLEKQVIGYRHGSGSVQPPGADVHVDMIPQRSEMLARTTYEKHFPNGAPYRRFMISSLWRPFSDPPQDWPLAVCDARSVGDAEGVPNRMVIVDELPDSEAARGPLVDEENMPAASAFHYSPGHRWWYFPDMDRDEVLIIKFYDSDRGRAWRAPHSAFRDPSVSGPAIRRSIEFRSIAYFL